MVYFPEAVFKHIISFLPRPCQVLARKIKHILPRILEDRGKNYRGVWRHLDYREYIVMVAEAHTNPLYFSIPWNPSWTSPQRADMLCKLSPNWHGPPDDINITVKSLKAYLKMNKIKGLSKKRYAELVAMCISF